jgi:small-conductance mechanosensitive channel
MAGIEFAPALGRVVTGMIFFIVSIMAISQLKIETEILRIVTSFLLAAGALAFGLSFGLGTREVTRNIVAGFYARRILRIGGPVEIGAVQGTLKAVTPTHTIVESEDRSISIANATFMEQVAKQ